MREKEGSGHAHRLLFRVSLPNSLPVIDYSIKLVSLCFLEEERLVANLETFNDLGMFKIFLFVPFFGKENN